MLPVDQAESIIFDLVKPLESSQDIQTVDLRDARGRVLATPVISHLDFPHWDNSAMDGYAVRYVDITGCTTDHQPTLEIVEEIPAGYQPQQTLQPGQAARIFTGACLPMGADTIVMQEDTQRQGDRVTILNCPPSTAFVRRQGSFYKAGELLLTPGILLDAAEMAVLAASQCVQVPVFRRVKVAIFSTGNELVTPDQPLGPGQLVDSNHYALTALMQKMGVEPLNFGIVRDDPQALKQTISEAISQADVVLSTGGVSVGDYDYIEQIITELDGKIHIQSVAMQPGKPLTVAKFPDCVYFGLPGNPVSALVACWRFIQPALRKLSGLKSEYCQPVFINARSLSHLQSKGKRETYLWGKLSVNNGEYEFKLAGGTHNSANLVNLAQTTGLAVLPVNCTQVEAGEVVKVLQV
ncbi:gephyrin-like molybdotransferase Glp [Lyngbya sp. PCC 8106]|uniref:molybdopterin molybdotransferase MoeA n=1 Tax=Lyngbya sp. (strain PCC 8106) TaxID=313612 RepID=UPI0000EA9733|nr:gephyrin-like molybdotransferase Glp [Lyngbya sp. PCC 8106]EAW34231.1 molybdopterin biosynthesis protein [Lyngbya sp. PCC 8106]